MVVWKSSLKGQWHVIIFLIGILVIVVLLMSITSGKTGRYFQQSNFEVC